MKKMLLMGYSGAGKTSMHSVIFANFPAKDTQKIGYTVERQEHKFKFMGTLTLNLWDCGGQDNFMEQYFLVQKETIFRGVEVLIYVFEIEDYAEKHQKILDYFEMTLKSIKQFNENANIFVLIHKIDKVPY
jgi:Ras-related GTP-binding protein A/B